MLGRTRPTNSESTVGKPDRASHQPRSNAEKSGPQSCPVEVDISNAQEPANYTRYPDSKTIYIRHENERSPNYSLFRNQHFPSGLSNIPMGIGHEQTHPCRQRGNYPRR